MEDRKGAGDPCDLNAQDCLPALALNNANAKETSALSEGGLASLIGMAFYARGMDCGGTALLIAFDQGTPYENENFAWFKALGRPFVYIDRVIVAEAARGLGIARLLYEDLFGAAMRAGHSRVVCEVNIEPPNPGSEAFHAAMGFSGVGEATIHNGAKRVRYFEKLLG